MKWGPMILAGGAVALLCAWLFVQGYLMGALEPRGPVALTTAFPSYLDARTVDEGTPRERIVSERKVPCRAMRGHDEIDLCAQWQAAAAASAGAWWARAGFWVSLLGTGGVIIALLLTRSGNKQARESAELASRAYLNIEKMRIFTKVGEPVRAKFIVKNNGSSPAIDVQLAGAIHWRRYGEDYAFPIKRPDIGSKLTLGVGAASRSDTTLAMVWSLGAEHSLENGDFLFYMYGEITYKDIYGRPHVTKYRMFHNNVCTKGRLLYAPAGNEAT